ncbi:MAG: M24 family metallopeptidase [Salinigranum sp.]
MSDYRLGVENSRTEHYPRFSEAEFERRWGAMRETMREEGLDVLLVHGDSTNVRYLTNYYRPESYVLFFADPDEPTTLFTKLSNHVQNVREISVVEDIRLLLPDPAAKIADRIREALGDGGTVGIVGHSPRYDYSISYGHYRALDERLAQDLVGATAAFTAVHRVKSDEEIDRIREAARLTDLGLSALVDRVEPGVREYELAAAFKSAYLAEGGETAVSFLSSAPMTDPEMGVGMPWKRPSDRKIEEGDVVNMEFGAGYWGYSTQIHRSIAVGRDPSPRYRELFDVAAEAYENVLDAIEPGNTARDVADALRPIEESPHKLYDVALHGGGNGYVPPFVGTADSTYWPGGDDPITADWTFEENQVLVVQPNVVTEDERHGLQFGTTVVVTDGGAENLHEFPAEFVRA